MRWVQASLWRWWLWPRKWQQLWPWKRQWVWWQTWGWLWQQEQGWQWQLWTHTPHEDTITKPCLNPKDTITKKLSLKPDEAYWWWRWLNGLGDQEGGQYIASAFQGFYLPFTVFVTYNTTRTSSETGENYLLDPPRNGRHFAGSFFWVIPRYGIPGLTKKKQVLFLVCPDIFSHWTHHPTGNFYWP